MNRAIVGRVEALAFKLVGEYGDLAVVFVAHDAAIAVFEGDLTAFEVEGVAVAVARGLAERADVAVFVEPAELAVVGNVAPEEVLADAAPGGAFGPEHAGVEALDRRVADLVLREALVQYDDVGIGVAGRGLAGPIARRLGRGVRQKDRAGSQSSGGFQKRTAIGREHRELQVVSRDHATSPVRRAFRKGKVANLEKSCGEPNPVRGRAAADPLG